MRYHCYPWNSSWESWKEIRFRRTDVSQWLHQFTGNITGTFGKITEVLLYYVLCLNYLRTLFFADYLVLANVLRLRIISVWSRLYWTHSSLANFKTCIGLPKLRKKKNAWKPKPVDWSQWVELDWNGTHEISKPWFRIFRDIVECIKL